MALEPSNSLITPKQRKAIQVALEPDVISYGDVGRALGITRQSARELLSNPHARQELDRLRLQRSDKTKGFWRQLDRMGHKLSDAMAGLSFKDIEPAQLGAWIKLYMDAATLAERLAPPDQDHDPAQFRQAKVALLEAGYKLGKGWKPCGLVPKPTRVHPTEG